MKRAALAALLGLALVAGCSGSSQPVAAGSATPTHTLSPTPTVSPTTSPSAASAPTAYESLVLRAKPRALYSLRDVTNGFSFGDVTADLVTRGLGATDVDGKVDSTTGPTLSGTTIKAASFSASGRLVTPLTTGFDASHAFSLEMWFRADGCQNTWGRAAGTENADVGGREGLSVFFYPHKAAQSCRLGVEVWHHSRYEIGCPTGMTAPRGTWVHLALEWSGGTLSCFQGGKLAESHHIAQAAFAQTAPFDIGSAGTGAAGVAGALSSGSISEVAVYGYAVPAAVFAQHAAQLH